MIERGKIEKIDGNTVMVRQEKGINCFGCMNQECKETKGIISAVNGTDKNLRAGQYVETEIPVVSVLAQAAGSLLPPLLAFAGFFIVSGLIFPALRENARAALGALGLFVTAGALYLVRRKYPPRSGPKVIRVLEQNAETG